VELEILKKTGAYLEGHFKLSSGLHSDKFIQCAKFLQTRIGDKVVEQFVEDGFENQNPPIVPIPDVVIGGAYGGIRIASLIAWYLGYYKKKDIRGIWCERVPEIEWTSQHVNDMFCFRGSGGAQPIYVGTDVAKIKAGEFQLRRGFEINKGEKVLIAEDVTTTGKSIGEVAELVKEHGGDIIGAISMVDRRKSKSEMLTYSIDGIPQDPISPFISLIRLDIKTWNPSDTPEGTACPLCKKGVPVTKPGSRS